MKKSIVIFFWATLFFPVVAFSADAGYETVKNKTSKLIPIAVGSITTFIPELSGVASEPTDNGTIAGIDTNHDGIRDDVERAIAIAFPGVENLKMMRYHMVMAQEIQKQLVFNSNSSAVLNSARRVLRFSDCIKKEGHDVVEVDRLLLPLSLNTWPRISAWANAMNQLTAHSISAESGICP